MPRVKRGPAVGAIQSNSGRLTVMSTSEPKKRSEEQLAATARIEAILEQGGITEDTEITESVIIVAPLRRERK